MAFRADPLPIYRAAMRTSVVFALLALACAREIRSTNPDLWLELESEHFTLRTDLPEEDARQAIANLELIRNALFAAGWHGKTSSPARIGVVAVASKQEVREFLPEPVEGMAGSDRFGERMILVSGEGNLLDSEVVKHEVTHALLAEFLVTNPRWVGEGIASFLETLDIDPRKGRAVRGASTWQRRDWVRQRKVVRWIERKSKQVNWSLEVMGMGAAFTNSGGYEFETLSWALVHWLVDAEPEKFVTFLTGLAKGQGMWDAFANAFPALSESQIAGAMERYLESPYGIVKTTFTVEPWSGQVIFRKLPRAEVHALRAQLFARFGQKEREEKLAAELALAKAVDPGHPLMLALSGNKGDLKLAIERHPEDWRSWEIWFDENHEEIAAIRKAAELAPNNAGVLARLAVAEQAAGQSAKAVALAERAVTISPGPFELHSLATVYEKNGRCSEAVVEEERAIESLPDRVEARILAAFRTRLDRITARCGKGDVIGTTARTVEAEPVIKICRQPLRVGGLSPAAIFVQFTVREDGKVSAVAIEGARDDQQTGILRQFVESCSFEPVIVDGRPRRVQLNLTLDAFLH